MSQNHIISIATIFNMWLKWILASGALALVVILSLIIPKIWLPFIVYGISYGLVLTLRADNARKALKACGLVVKLASEVLFWTATVMLAINLMAAEWFFGNMLDDPMFNPSQPYITSLILFPVVIAMSAYALFAGQNLTYCRNCRRAHGYYSGDGLVATLFYHESKFQIRLLLAGAIVISVITWIYYLVRYVNINFNSADIFIFHGLPVIFFIFGAVYMSARYRSIAASFSRIGVVDNQSAALTRVRFLVLSGDHVYLRSDSNGLFDTPATETVSRTEKLTDEQARRYFAGLSGLDDFELKYIYSNDGFAGGSNIIHYAAFIPDNNIGRLAPADPMTLDGLDRLIKASMISPLLANEIYRIYTVTMAWKTYDREGRRLYPIRHYRPTFRLRDLREWAVDYNDLHWLNIATNNQDCAFYRLRRLWRRLFSSLRRTS